MNIGLERLMPVVTTAPSLEDMFSQYADCEQFLASTERFSAYGDQLFDTFDNLLSLGETAKKFGSTEGLAVIDALVGREFGGHFSMETLKDTTSKVWAKIKEWFVKIWNWIKTFFYRVLNFFGGAEKRLKNMLSEYKKAKAPCKPWKFSGISGEMGSSNAVVKAATKLEEITSKLEAGNYDKEEKIAADLQKGLELLEKRQQVYEVKSNTDAEKVINEALSLVKGIPQTKKLTEKLYTAANKAYSKASTENDIKKAKIAQKAAAAAVKLDHAWASPIMRTVASIMANGRYKSIK